MLSAEKRQQAIALQKASCLGYAGARSRGEVDGVADFFVLLLGGVEVEGVDGQRVANAFTGDVLEFVVEEAVSDGVELGAIALDKNKFRERAIEIVGAVAGSRGWRLGWLLIRGLWIGIGRKVSRYFRRSFLIRGAVVGVIVIRNGDVDAAAVEGDDHASGGGAGIHTLEMRSAGSFAEGRLVASNGIYRTNRIDRAAEDRSRNSFRSGSAGGPVGSNGWLRASGGRMNVRVNLSRGMRRHSMSGAGLTAGDGMSNYGRRWRSYDCVLLSRYAESQNGRE